MATDIVIPDLDKLLVKEPFKTALPCTCVPRTVTDGMIHGEISSRLRYEYVTQDDFLSQWYPTGHYIHVHDTWKDYFIEVSTDEKDENGKDIKRKELRKLQRRAFPLQQMIHNKRCSHLCTNQIRFQLKKSQNIEENQSKFTRYKESWTEYNMETAKNELIRKAGRLGDAAVYLYTENDDIKYQVFSYDKGDVLYPHKDAFGNYIAFVRQYNFSYLSEDNVMETEKLYDVWTRKHYYTLDSEGELFSRTDIFGNEVGRGITEHNLGFVPIAYLRFETVFWGQVQDLIDDFEFLMSIIGEHNIRQAFQMLHVKTDGGLNVEESAVPGTGIVVTDTKGDANWLGKNDANNTLFTELDHIYSGILDGSGVVPPMQASSGDRPNGTTAMYYEPELEFSRGDLTAINEAMLQMVKMFKYFVGYIENNIPDYTKLKINATIELYSYTDFTAWNNILINLANSGVISKKTAMERSDFSADDEEERMAAQEKKLKEDEAEKVLQQWNLEMSAEREALNNELESLRQTA